MPSEDQETASPRATLQPATTLSGDDDAPTREAPPIESPEFAIEREVGRGGMGVVFLARQRSLGREVALKALLPGLDDARFAAEAAVTGRLEHPGVPPVYLFAKDEAGRAFLAMKLVRGVSWAELLEPQTEEARGRAAGLDLRGHLEILKRVCEATAYAHSRGVIHRDLKPENVMVGEFGEALVVDWGVALDARAPRREAAGVLQQPVGTPAYMAPEMAECREEAIGPATDVYLLGGVLYEILTGKPPHEGASVFEALIAAREGSVEPPAARAPGRRIPEALAELAMRALERDPARRPGSPMEIVRGIDEHFRREAAAALAEFAEGELAAARRAEKRSEAYGRLAGAVAALVEAARMAPGPLAEARVARARLAYAEFALGAGDLGLAEAEIDRVEAAAPGLAEARARLARARARRRRVKAALVAMALLAAAAGFLAIALGTARARRQRAEAELAKVFWSDRASKIAACERAVAIDPEWAEGHARLGRAYLDLDVATVAYAERTDAARFESEFERARTSLARSIALRPDPSVILDQASATAMLGDWPASLALYRRCAAVGPATRFGVEAAGLVALDERRFADAAACFSRCLEIDPQEMDWFNRAAARYAAGDLDGALADAREVSRAHPGEEWYLALEALVHTGRGESRAAGARLAEGLARHDLGPHLLPLLAYRAALMGDRARAEAALARARAAQRKFARAFLALDPHWRPFARAAAPLDGPGRAVVLDFDIERILPARPAPHLVLRREGEERLAAGDFAGALALADRALAEDAADGIAARVRGRALGALGHAEAAREELELAERLAPEER